jgi:D-alanine-D-alanine ligase
MEVLTEKEFFDYDAKYKRDRTKEIFPDLEKDIKEEIENISLKIYKKLCLTDIARIDFLFSDKLYFLEVNTIPGMTPTSFLPQCVKHYGYK